MLAATREAHGLATSLLVFLLLPVGMALVAGLWPAVVSAVLGSMLLNYWFMPPLYALKVADPENVLALAVFVLVAVVVASVVDLAARRSAQAARSRAESETLGRLARSVLDGEDTVAAVLQRTRDTFGMEAVSLLERADPTSPWMLLASSGPDPFRDPERADASVLVDAELSMALRGPPLHAADQRVLDAFAAHTAVVLERERLRERAEEARRLEQGNAIRTALLAAVSHDLRTPLAAIKAATTSLRQDDVTWSAGDEDELLETVEESADRLQRLIDNLLDLSRLQTGGVHPHLHAVSLDEVVPRAVEAVPLGRVIADIPEDLPLVRTDAGLLERVVANIVENADKYSPRTAPIVVSATAESGWVTVRVVDRGAGISDEAKPRMFHAFQRLGDATAGTAGVGLGLAVARGFTDALGGTLHAEDTPGGGLTMVLRLPVIDAVASSAAVQPPAGSRGPG